LKAFEEALEYITGHSDVWVTTGREIAEHYAANHYDAALADIADRTVGGLVHAGAEASAGRVGSLGEGA
jgi:hypothetical protein